MRRFYPLMALALFLQACAGIPIPALPSLPFLSTETLAPTPTATVTFTPTVTNTPTITPTITPSATIVRIPTQDPNSTSTPVPTISILIGDATATAPIPSTPITPGDGFLSMTVSATNIQWGVCDPHKSTIVVEVEKPEDVHIVTLFMRVKSAKKEDYTPWSNGDTMENHRDGTFSYVLNANYIYGHNHYKNSVVFIQMVATDKKGVEVGRTRVFENLIALSPCM